MRLIYHDSNTLQNTTSKFKDEQQSEG